MKKNRLAAGALALVVSISAGGCGNQVYELTDEEESVIVHYSAHAVTKFNKRQSEGISDVTVLKAQMEEEKQKEEEKKKEQEEEKKEEAKEQKPAADGTQKNDSKEQGGQAEYVSLKQALGLGGIDAAYNGHEIVSSYGETQSFAVSPASGNELLVLHINLKNNGSKTVNCNLLSKMPAFRLTVNNDVSVSADTTILLNDLGTYQGKIQAGDTVKTVLVFQVKKGSVKKINSMDLQVLTDGTSAAVQLAAD